MSPSKKFPFSVEVTTAWGSAISSDSTITVLDGHDNVKGTERGTVMLKLPAGLYSVRVERAGISEEEIHRHSGPTAIAVPEPKRYSAVPMNGTASSHEYYQEPAAKWSRSTTAPPISPGAGPTESLFLFLRAPSSEAASAGLDKSVLRILDYSGAELVALDEETTQRDLQAGWLAFNAQTSPGAYVLRYDPRDGPGPAREMAIAVFPRWQTQIFMTLGDGPSFASASVLLGHGFDPNDRVSKAVDSALSGLQNGVDLLLPNERRMLLHGKFANPMLGLVGAHAMFLSPKPDKSVIAEVVGNLGRLLGEKAPDVRALRLMEGRRFGKPVAVEAFDDPPMIRAGLEAVLEAAAEWPSLVPPDGLLARMAPQRFVDSPWSTWKPLVAEGVEATHVALRGWNLRRTLERALRRDVPVPETGATEWVSGYVRDAALQAARKDQDLDIAKVAARASLPVASVSQAYEDLRASMEPSSKRTLEFERLVSRSRREASERDIDIDDARHMFFEGSEGERVQALGWMQGSPSIQDFDVALDGVAHSRSAFEQYHALRLIRQMIPNLADEQRQTLADAVAEERSPGQHISPGTDRWYLSDQILSELDVEPRVR